jgi:hypothetical protein
MLDKTEADVATITVGVLDDAYCGWFTAESECEMALRDWFHATKDTREVTYLAYRAALDREEASARELELRWDTASGCGEAAAAKPQNVAE